MYQSDTEILFPMRVAPYLRDLRGSSWFDLVQMVTDDKEASLNQLAFSLLLVRLCGCLTCHTDSYRAMRGCTICATQVVRRFKGEDKDLIKLFKNARKDVKRFLRFDRHSDSIRFIQLPTERKDE
jgi:hypothetical protein